MLGFFNIFCSLKGSGCRRPPPCPKPPAGAFILWLSLRSPTGYTIPQNNCGDVQPQMGRCLIFDASSGVTVHWNTQLHLLLLHFPQCYYLFICWFVFNTTASLFMDPCRQQPPPTPILCCWFTPAQLSRSPLELLLAPPSPSTVRADSNNSGVGVVTLLISD